MQENLPHDTENVELFGMTWQEIFALRDARARVYAHRFKYQVPLEELRSAANLAITEALTRYIPQRENPSFKGYLWKTLSLAFYECRRRELKGCFSQPGAHTASRKLLFTPVSYVDIDTCALGSHIPYDEAYDASRCLAALHMLATNQEQQMLLASLQGETDRAIGTAHGKSNWVVFTTNKRTLRRLQDWACRGLPLPVEQTRRTVKLTPALVATIRRLFSEAIPKTTIARRLGCGRKAIYQALKQRDTVCPGQPIS